ncbi:hypothetical protein A2U01_0025063, partial [Trifolium medium]|nr:hypothetical protein [Trifolium medium]
MSGMTCQLGAKLADEYNESYKELVAIKRSIVTTKYLDTETRENASNKIRYCWQGCQKTAKAEGDAGEKPEMPPRRHPPL